MGQLNFLIVQPKDDGVFWDFFHYICCQIHPKIKVEIQFTPHYFMGVKIR